MPATDGKCPHGVPVPAVRLRVVKPDAGPSRPMCVTRVLRDNHDCPDCLRERATKLRESINVFAGFIRLLPRTLSSQDSALLEHALLLYYDDVREWGP